MPHTQEERPLITSRGSGHSADPAAISVPGEHSSSNLLREPPLSLPEKLETGSQPNVSGFKVRRVDTGLDRKPFFLAQTSRQGGALRGPGNAIQLIDCHHLGDQPTEQLTHPVQLGAGQPLHAAHRLPPLASSQIGGDPNEAISSGRLLDFVAVLDAKLANPTSPLSDIRDGREFLTMDPLPHVLLQVAQDDAACPATRAAGRASPAVTPDHSEPKPGECSERDLLIPLRGHRGGEVSQFAERGLVLLDRIGLVHAAESRTVTAEPRSDVGQRGDSVLTSSTRRAGEALSPLLHRLRHVDRSRLAKALSMMDLFAGCGGMTAGFTERGFTSSLAVEVDRAAAATFAANFGDHIFCGDIAELDESLIPEVDVVIGGPPCQGFSNLGNKTATDPRNKLWQQYVRVVVAARPMVFVIENVDRFASSSEFALLQEMVATGLLQEYEIRFGVLNAADYGVPQRRRRTIVIGSRIGTIELPAPTHAKGGADGRTPWATVREAFGEIPWWTTTTAMPASQTTFTDIAGTEITAPGIFKELDLHFGRRPTDLSLARYDRVPPGGGRFDLPDELLPRCWREKLTGTTDVLGRMKWDAPSLTVRTEFFKPEKGQYLHPQWDAGRANRRVNRVITHREAARLQAFPPEFLWCGTKVQIAKQIGNAVPVRLASAIAAHVRSAIDATAVPSREA